MKIKSFFPLLVFCLTIILWGISPFKSSSKEWWEEPTVVENNFQNNATATGNSGPDNKVQDIIKDKVEKAESTQTSAEKKFDIALDQKIFDFGLASGARGNIECLGGDARQGLYRFNQSKIEFTVAEGKVYPGKSVSFKGKIKNAFDTPIVNAALFAKIFRKDMNEANNRLNGDFEIASLYLIKDINLRAREERAYQGSWQVPKGLIEGDYYLALFFVQSERYNLSGINFAPDAFRPAVYFKIEKIGEPAMHFFEKDSLKINDRSYNLKTPELSFGIKDKVSVSVPYRNSSAKKERVTIDKILYNWDTLRKENVIKEAREVIEVEAGQSTLVKWELDNRSYPEYVVKFKSALSEIDIRYSKPGIARARLNFPVIDKFPIERGDSFRLFSCFHSMSNTPEMGEVKLTLWNEQKKKVAESSYKGLIPGTMSAFVKDFTAKTGLNYLKLNAKIYNHSGQLVDEDTLVYDCDKLRLKGCRSMYILGLEKNLLILISLFVVLIIGLTVILWLKARHRRGVNTHSNSKAKRES